MFTTYGTRLRRQMAKFLNNPSKVNLLGTNWQLLLESLDFEFTAEPFPPWTVPAGKLTDGPSVPSWLDWLTPRSKFMLSGYLHDDIRNKWSTGNAATDGMLRDAVMAEAAQSLDGMKAWQAYLIYLGVRIGTHTGFKSSPPDAVVQEARKRYAKYRGVSAARIEFDKYNCELIVKDLP